MPGGILPWERDSDIGWDAEKYAKVNDTMRKELYDMYGCKLGNMEYKTKFKEDIASCRNITNHSCLYFPLFVDSWRIELYGVPNVESEQLHGLRSHTLVMQDGIWAPTYFNPGLDVRNWYGDNILGHIQHWLDYREPHGWTRYTNVEVAPFLQCPTGFPKHACLQGNYFPLGNIQFQDSLV
ncbi:unnamed protein product [Calicophoron daubneyi]